MGSFITESKGVKPDIPSVFERPGLPYVITVVFPQTSAPPCMAAQASFDPLLTHLQSNLVHVAETEV